MSRRLILVGPFAAFVVAFLAGRAGAQLAPGIGDLGRRLPGVDRAVLQTPRLASIANLPVLCEGSVFTGRSAVIRGENLGASAGSLRVKIVQAGRADVFPRIDRWSAGEIRITLARGPNGRVSLGLANPSGAWASNVLWATVREAGVDLDGDGHPSIAMRGDDCDDCDADRYPGNPEMCDARGHDEDCDPSTPGHRDADGDGFSAATCRNVEGGTVRSAGDDCDDGNRSVHPNQIDPCNGIDDDCDGEIDESGGGLILYRDADGDGFGDASASRPGCRPIAGYSTRAGDCNDRDRNVQPGHGCPTGCR